MVNIAHENERSRGIAVGKPLASDWVSPVSAGVPAKMRGRQCARKLNKWVGWVDPSIEVSQPVVWRYRVTDWEVSRPRAAYSFSGEASFGV